MVRRSSLATATALVITLLPLITPWTAQAQVNRQARVGILFPMTASADRLLAPFTEALRDLGYVAGQNVSIEVRSADGQADRFPGLAGELVRRKVDVLVAVGDPAIAAAQKATTSIPIVMAEAADPIALGFVATLSRPGGNITGLSFQSLDMLGKRIQLLKEAIPRLSRLAVLWPHDAPDRPQAQDAARAAARALGIQARFVELPRASNFKAAFTAAVQARADAAYIHGSLLTYSHRAEIAGLALTHRLPTVCGILRGWVEAGCLIGYGPSNTLQLQRAASFVEKILKGAKPADLPVEQPTKVELVINAKTATLLGLTIPPSVLIRADEVIQ